MADCLRPCCGSGGIPREIQNVITDGLEICLTIPEGKSAFRDFIEKNGIEKSRHAINFYFKCDEILEYNSKCSPKSRNKKFSEKLKEDFIRLYEMADEFDLDFKQKEMEILEEASESRDDDKKIEVIKEARKWSMKLLEQTYNLFRKKIVQDGTS